MEQNAYFNGHRKGCTINNVIVFAPDGTIIFTKFNCPGSYHDMRLCDELIMDGLRNRTPDGYNLLADNGFDYTASCIPGTEGKVIFHKSIEYSLHLYVATV